MSYSTHVIPVVILSLLCGPASAADKQDFSLALRYVKVEQLSKEDHARLRSIKADDQPLLQEDTANLDSIEIVIHGRQAKYVRKSLDDSNLARPDEKTLALFRQAGVKMFDKPGISTETTETLIWNDERKQTLRTVERKQTSFDFEQNDTRTTTKNKQVVNTWSDASKCEAFDLPQFEFPTVESPCQIQSWIDKEYIVADGRSSSVDVTMVKDVDADPEQQTIQCKYYGKEQADTGTSAGGDASGKCLYFLNSVPVIVLDDSYGNRARRMDENSLIRYRLESIDFSPQIDESTFDLSVNQVCASSNNSEGEWVRC